MKKLTLKSVHMTILMISGIISLSIGTIREVLKFFESLQRKKIVEETDRMVGDMMMVMAPIRESFINDHWQMLLAGFGLILMIVSIIIGIRIRRKK